MSVESRLGLDADMGQVTADAWASWAGQLPQLAVVEDPRDLRAWLKDADDQWADDVLCALVWLGSVDGGDDVVAAKAICWVLTPGAAFIAWQLCGLSPDIDHLVASELWMAVRTFPLHRRKVMANLMRDVRSRVLEHCEVPATLRRTDPTWFSRGGSIESSTVQAMPAHGEPSALEELVDLLEWACEDEVISPEDKDLVLLLVETAERLGTRDGTSSGLLGNDATAEVAQLMGVSGRTIRRRASRCIGGLTAAARRCSRVA